jgi:hypothetical protein
MGDENMRALLLTGVAVSLVLVGVVGCETTGTSGVTSVVDKAAPSNAPAKTACAACQQGKSGKTVWCAKCDVGYVDGKKTACKGCFAQKTGGPACPVCSKKKP